MKFSCAPTSDTSEDHSIRTRIETKHPIFRHAVWCRLSGRVAPIFNNGWRVAGSIPAITPHYFLIFTPKPLCDTTSEDHSIRTRIETWSWLLLWFVWWTPQKIIPLEQGLKHEETGEVIQPETPQKIIPLEQGLKLVKRSPSLRNYPTSEDHSIRTRIETGTSQRRTCRAVSCPQKIIPLEQGLKQICVFGFGFKIVPSEDHSIRTRIETPIPTARRGLSRYLRRSFH